MGRKPFFILPIFMRIDLIELLNRVGAEMWGVTVTLSWDQKGCSGGKGSSLKTSNVHPESFPLSSAFRRSSSSINPPLPALIKIAPVLIISSDSEFIIVFVLSVSGSSSIK